MGKLLQSKAVAWIALLIVVVIIITTFNYRPAWWAFIDEFFAFMMVFSQLAALYIYKFNRYSGKRLQIIAAWFGILMIISFIGEFIVYEILYT